MTTIHLQNFLIFPKWDCDPTKHSLPIPRPLAPGPYHLLSFSMILMTPGTSYKWDRTLSVLLCLASFPKHHDLKVHLHQCMCWKKSRTSCPGPPMATWRRQDPAAGVSLPEYVLEVRPLLPPRDSQGPEVMLEPFKLPGQFWENESQPTSGQRSNSASLQTSL